jgi:hypothetical protein
MTEKKQSGSEREPAHPETEAARHAREEGRDPRQTGDSISSDDEGRFSGDGEGERGYRGDEAEDTPPGSVPGGSYGGGGGVSQGGHDHAPPKEK